MAVRMTLICVPTGNESYAPLFPSRDRLVLPFEILSEKIRRRLNEADHLIHSPAIVIGSSASVRARAEAAEALSDLDYGSWTNRAMADIARDDPGAFELWRTDMAAAPHGGESVVSARERVGQWLTSIDERIGHIVTMCPAVIARIVLVAALDAPLPMIWRLDLMPWSAVELTRYGGRWALRLG